MVKNKIVTLGIAGLMLVSVVGASAAPVYAQKPVEPGKSVEAKVKIEEKKGEVAPTTPEVAENVTTPAVDNGLQNKPVTTPANDKQTAEKQVAQNPTGNNGTLKVHEKGTPAGTESNDPKVCAFNFEGFGFDANQDGYIRISEEMKTNPSTYELEIDFAANANGYDETIYVNDGSGLTLANGKYKATLYGKDTGGNIDLSDVKAKSKVFKVTCEDVDEETPTNPPVTPDDDGEVLSGNPDGKGQILPNQLPVTGSSAPAFILMVLASIAAIAGLGTSIVRLVMNRGM